jgi:hypothetical protein
MSKANKKVEENEINQEKSNSIQKPAILQKQKLF